MIIGITGKMGSGKDTIGKIIQYLIVKTRENSIIATEGVYSPTSLEDFKAFCKCDTDTQSNWQIVKFADALKDIVCILTGCTREQLEDINFKNSHLSYEWRQDIESTKGMTYRKLLQKLGTDLIRNQLHKNTWVNALFANIDKELDANPNYNKNYKSDYIYLEPIFIKTLEGKYNLYKCCCGKEFKANKYKIRSKHTKSCGCYQKYRAGLTQFKDGRKGTRLWNIYNNMIQRCENINHPRYKDYGGRGIIVSDEFKPYENFKNWALSNGYTDTLSIDRIDNNDIYCPDNCKFSTDSEQVINTRVRKDNSSGFRGVSKDKHNWRASIQIQGKQKFLGYFNTPEEASIAYEKAFSERENLYSRKQVKKGFIITDVRFQNEVEAVKSRGGIVVRINRGNTTDQGESNPHTSETALDDAEFDYTIDNNGTIEELIEKVKEILIKEHII